MSRISPQSKELRKTTCLLILVSGLFLTGGKLLAQQDVNVINTPLDVIVLDMPLVSLPADVNLNNINQEQWVAAYQALNSAGGIEVKNDAGPAITVNDSELKQLMTEWIDGIKSSEVAKLKRAQTTQGNIINWLTDKTDRICQAWMKFPDTGTCKRGVSNWATDFQRDIPANIKANLHTGLEKLSFLDPLAKKEMDDAYLQSDLSPVGNPAEYFYKLFYGQEPLEIRPNSTAGTLLFYLMTRNETLKNTLFRAYVGGLVGQAQEIAKFATEIGGGQWGMFEQTRKTVVIDTTTGEPVQGEEYYDDADYSYTITPGMAGQIVNLGTWLPDVISSFTSPFFNAIEASTETRLDDNGVFQSGLFVNGAVQSTARLGFMLPNTLGLQELPPSCSLDISPTREATLLGQQDIKTFDIAVRPSNGTFQDATLSTDKPELINLSRTSSNQPNFSTSISLQASAVNSGTAVVTVTANVKNDANTQLKDASCQGQITLTIIPVNLSCQVNITPNEVIIRGTGDFDSIAWQNAGGAIGGPNPETFTLKKNVTVSITAQPSFSDLQKFLNYIKNSLNNNVLVYLPGNFSSLALPSTFSSQSSSAELNLKNIGQFKFKTEVNTNLGAGNSTLCSAEIPVSVGYRANSSRCPVPTCTGGQEACCKRDPNTGNCITTPIHSTYSGGCRTEYCDYYTGVRLSDGNNAYALDACPFGF